MDPEGDRTKGHASSSDSENQVRMNVVLKQSWFIKPEPFSVLISHEAKTRKSVDDIRILNYFFLIRIFYYNNSHEHFNIFYISSLYQ